MFKIFYPKYPWIYPISNFLDISMDIHGYGYPLQGSALNMLKYYSKTIMMEKIWISREKCINTLSCLLSHQKNPQLLYSTEQVIWSLLKLKITKNRQFSLISLIGQEVGFTVFRERIKLLVLNQYFVCSSQTSTGSKRFIMEIFSK